MVKMMRTDNGTVEGSGLQDPAHIMKIRGIEKRFHRGLHLVLVFIGLITDLLLPDNVATSPKNSIIGNFKNSFQKYLPILQTEQI